EVQPGPAEDRAAVAHGVFGVLRMQALDDIRADPAFDAGHQGGIDVQQGQAWRLRHGAGQLGGMAHGARGRGTSVDGDDDMHGMLREGLGEVWPSRAGKSLTAVSGAAAGTANTSHNAYGLRRISESGSVFPVGSCAQPGNPAASSIYSDSCEQRG